MVLVLVLVLVRGLWSGEFTSHPSATDSENAAYSLKDFVAREGSSRGTCQAALSSGRKEQSRWPPTANIRWPPSTLLATPPGGPQSQCRWPQ